MRRGDVAMGARALRGEHLFEHVAAARVLGRQVRAQRGVGEEQLRRTRVRRAPMRSSPHGQRNAPSGTARRAFPACRSPAGRSRRTCPPGRTGWRRSRSGDASLSAGVKHRRRAPPAAPRHRTPCTALRAACSTHQQQVAVFERRRLAERVQLRGAPERPRGAASARHAHRAVGAADPRSRTRRRTFRNASPLCSLAFQSSATKV